MTSDPRSTIRHLADRLSELARADTPSAAFKTLIEASRFLAPRSAIFLVRQGEVRGWGGTGYDTAAAQALRGFRCRPEAGWLGRVLAAPSGLVSRLEAGNDPDFGQPASHECVGGAIRIKGKPMAAMIAERGADEQPWLPEALGMLIEVAGLRLELDLAMRKLDRAGSAVAAQPAATVRTTPPAASPRPATVSPTPPAETLTPVETVAVTPLVAAGTESSPELDAARRFAKLVATDIRLYNEEAVMNGRRNGDLADRLAEHLGRGKSTFLKRHGDLGPTALELLHEAFVQVLAAGDASLIPPGALE